MILISMEPVMFGIWPPGETFSTDSEISIKWKEHCLISMKGSLVKQLTCNKKDLIVWEPKSTHIHNMTRYERWVELPQLLKQSKKSKFTFTQDGIKHLAGCYFYPRKIYLVVVKTNDYLNIFPMDLHLPHPRSREYVFALQPSNIAQNHLSKNRKLVVCELPSSQLPLAYELGKNHGKINLINTQLPFSCNPSKNFEFPVPDFSIGYKEILVSKSYRLNTHSVFMAEVIHEETVKTSTKQPFHVHRFHYRYGLKERFFDRRSRLPIS
jgi:hypothetical protein